MAKKSGDPGGFGGLGNIAASTRSYTIREINSVPLEPGVEYDVYVRGSGAGLGKGGRRSRANNVAAETGVVTDAGDDVTVRAGARVALDGSGSRSYVSGTPTYAWKQTAGPEVTLDDASSATPAFIAPSVSSSTDLTFSLTVEVGESSVTDTVTVTVLPSRVVSATVDGTALTVTFDSALDATSKPASSAFTVTARKPGSSRIIRGTGSPVAISGKTVTATLGSAVAADETATVSYEKPTSGAVLKDTSNNELESFANRRVGHASDMTGPAFVSAAANGDTLTVNEVGGFGVQPFVPVTNNTPPAFKSASVNGDTLRITFNGALDTGSVPAASACC